MGAPLLLPSGPSHPSNARPCDAAHANFLRIPSIDHFLTPYPSVALALARRNVVICCARFPTSTCRPRPFWLHMVSTSAPPIADPLNMSTTHLQTRPSWSRSHTRARSLTTCMGLLSGPLDGSPCMVERMACRARPPLSCGSLPYHAVNRPDSPGCPPTTPQVYCATWPLWIRSGSGGRRSNHPDPLASSAPACVRCAAPCAIHYRQPGRVGHGHGTQTRCRRRSGSWSQRRCATRSRAGSGCRTVWSGRTVIILGITH